MKDRILICRRTSYGPSGVPSITEECYRCAEPVWVAGSSPAHDKVLCTDCAIADNEAKPVPPTARQMEEVQRAIETFEMVKEDDLRQIKGLCEVVERLCDSLRSVRREHPDRFFGQPIEALYDSLEAALGSFYASQDTNNRHS